MNKTAINIFQLCDVKEETYYCHEHALEYLQKMKQGQRRHCKCRQRERNDNDK